ncbi:MULTISPECIES: S24 family peptidase [Pseudomonas putida group]|uniref:S24 family peptidase n=1 Tax=Pseudomonas putida group TaxID=136845 RepID=UPI000CD3D439|nr:MULTISPECIES: S24 family peptidase [Pseudomonas putida group]EKT4454407.1 S24 family peptidase [Pseudomonas putida]EKT4511222.1 S24 family peptidase [Pseudomonas putida]MDH0023895.1 S24 family peptidase [Pseudomonas monteilii]POF93201.1 repressor [Pseudomonas putida]
MLTGPELGAAIDAARIAKGVSKKQLADDFQVKPPSVQGWVKNGRIDKSKLMDVIAYFSDVVGPEHWGLRPGFSYESIQEVTSEPVAEPAPTSAADMVRAMLAKQGKNLSDSARAQLIAAAEATDEGNVITVDFTRPGLVGDEVRIAHYDIRAAMGGGQLPHDYPEMLKDIRVSPSHLREIGVEFEEHYHLKVVTGWGQSMEPTIKHRDPLIVNINVRDFVGDGVYLFVWDDLLYIKRLQVADEEHYEMISDNPRHKDRLIRRDMTYIQARVLLVWNAHLV